MERVARLRWLRIVLVVCGVLCISIYPLTILWPAGWSWHPRGSHSEQMIAVFYAVLGIFLFRAVRDPMRNLSLIWFTVWSSVAHAGLMAWQSLTDPSEHGHMMGDVPALFIGAIVLGLLTPLESKEHERQEERQAPTGPRAPVHS